MSIPLCISLYCALSFLPADNFLFICFILALYNFSVFLGWSLSYQTFTFSFFACYLLQGKRRLANRKCKKVCCLLHYSRWCNKLEYLCLSLFVCRCGNPMQQPPLVITILVMKWKYFLFFLWISRHFQVTLLFYLYLYFIKCC